MENHVIEEKFVQYLSDRLFRNADTLHYIGSRTIIVGIFLMLLDANAASYTTTASGVILQCMAGYYFNRSRKVCLLLPEKIQHQRARRLISSYFSSNLTLSYFAIYGAVLLSFFDENEAGLLALGAGLVGPLVATYFSITDMPFVEEETREIRRKIAELKESPLPPNL